MPRASSIYNIVVNKFLSSVEHKIYIRMLVIKQALIVLATN